MEGIDLGGRIAVVTGTATSPGRAAAVVLGRAGAHVCCIDPAVGDCQETVAIIEEFGGHASSHRASPDARLEVDEVISAIASHHGRIDIMCTTASQPGDGKQIEDIDVADFDRVFRANFMSALFGAQSAGRIMAAIGGGSIICMSSAIIDVPASRTGSFAIAAAAVAFLAKVMAKEVGERNVRVNAIAPSPNIGGSPFPADAEAAAFSKQVESKAVLARAGVADDFAQLVLFLASDAAAYITGQTIRLTGGWTMPW